MIFKDKLELIFLHIPKTAGCSFRTQLELVYGVKNMQRIDLFRYKNTKDKDILDELPKIARRTKVIHGHFNYLDLYKFYDIRTNIPVITWLRDPVERVISNYFYLHKRMCGYINESSGKVEIMEKIGRTLVEYASDDASRNRMSKFLKGVVLDKLYYVGIVEYMGDDLRELATMLKWPPVKEVHHNISTDHLKSDRMNISNEIREEIRILNNEDIALYNEAIALRNKRLISLENV